MKNKFVKMTAAVLAGMMLLTGCGQSADSTGAANDSAAQGTENTTADAAADSTASGDKVKIEQMCIRDRSMMGAPFVLTDLKKILILYLTRQPEDR